MSEKRRQMIDSVKHREYLNRQRLLLDRIFWSQVRVSSNGCWIYTGVIGPYGYGKLVRDRIKIGAHRWSWILARGPIPEGLNVLHHCDNPPCVNPDHLFLGTQVDNLADMRAKGRQARKHASRRLNGAKAREIRALLADGSRKSDVARLYGVTWTTIYRIAKGTAWRNA